MDVEKQFMIIFTSDLIQNDGGKTLSDDVLVGQCAMKQLLLNWSLFLFSRSVQLVATTSLAFRSSPNNNNYSIIKPTATTFKDNNNNNNNKNKNTTNVAPSIPDPKSIFGRKRDEPRHSMTSI